MALKLTIKTYRIEFCHMFSKRDKFQNSIEIFSIKSAIKRCHQDNFSPIGCLICKFNDVHEKLTFIDTNYWKLFEEL